MAKPLRIGVAGLGTIGSALVRLLGRRRADLAARAGREVTLVGVSDLRRDRGLDLDGACFYDDAASLAKADIDVFVELIGGAGGAAYDAAKAVLSRGVPLVTANKAMIAAHGLELAALAEANGAALAFEAAVAGGIPVVKTLREGLAGNAIRRVSGILNGTCNYILSRMETDGLPFDVCLADAQSSATPRRTRPSTSAASIRPTSSPSSPRWRSAPRSTPTRFRSRASRPSASPTSPRPTNWAIASSSSASPSARRKGVEQRVHPTMVAKSEPLGQTMGVLNAVTIDGDAVGALTLVGAGAGGDPTASAVAADIADIARGDFAPAFGRPVAALEDAERVPMQRHEGGYYVRLAVVDRPGSMASIATRMGERKISLEAIMQKRPAKGAPSTDIAPVVLITHATTEASIREALALAVADGVVKEKPQVIRIERA